MKNLIGWSLAALLMLLAFQMSGADRTPSKQVKQPVIDVSYHSGAIDWHMVNALGIRIVILKATEGIDLKDKNFASHWKELKEKNFLRGAYHLYVTEDDPETQAHFFIAHAPLEPGDLVPIVDIELIGHGTHGRLYPKVKRFLDVMEAHFHVKPMIYTSPRFWSAHFKRHFQGYPLWIAEYGVSRPSIPEGWKTWHLWQYRENAPVQGVAKGADLSRVNQALGIWQSLLIPSR